MGAEIEGCEIVGRDLEGRTCRIGELSRERYGGTLWSGGAEIEGCEVKGRVTDPPLAYLHNCAITVVSNGRLLISYNYLNMYIFSFKLFKLYQCILHVSLIILM